MKKKRFLLLGLLVGLMVFAFGVASASAEDITWNPNDKGDGITLTSGNLIVNPPTTTSMRGVRATKGVSSGKYYWEIKATGSGIGAYNGAPVTLAVGAVTQDHTLTNTPIYGKEYVFIDSKWGISINGTQYGYNSYKFASGNIIGIALDMDNKNISFYKNGVQQGSAYSINSEHNILYPYAYVFSSEYPGYAEANFGATPFTYSVPEGYQPFNEPIQAPTGLIATVGDSQVNLSWTEVTGATSYNIKRSTSSGDETTVASSVYAYYTDTGLMNGTTYYYVVTAVGTDGESANSNEVSATPQAALPNIPTNLTATAGDAQVSLAWGSVTGATGYKVKWATAQGGPYTNIIDVSGISYTHSGLTNGTTYYYIVTAVTAGGESGNSNEVSATPQAGSTPPASGNGTLIVTVANNADREYNLTMAQIQAFIDWYNNRSTGGNVYIIEKTATAPYTKVKDYLIFDKIVAWQVKEY